MDQQHGDGPVVLLVRNIPAALKSADLRAIFRDAVDDGRVFSTDNCSFHYRHRPESRLPAAVAVACAPAPASSPSPPSSSEPCCCIIRMPNAGDAAHFVEQYKGVNWHTKEGEELGEESGVITISLLQLDNYDELARQLPELNPPRGLPHGNVGTCRGTILRMINDCKLPASVIKKLSIKFRTEKKRLYSHVAPPCPDNPTSTAPRSKREVKRKKTAAPAAVAPAAAAALTAASQWRRRDRSVLVAEAAADAAVATAGPVGGGRATGIEREDHDAEEWDRHVALNGEPDARDKDGLFEEEVTYTWEKGGSGLVFNTDASSLWEQTQNDFDEKTTDDLDVDVSGYYEEGAGDQGFKDLHDLRRTGVHRPHPGLRGRQHQGDVVEERARAAADFEKYTKGVGSRILGAHGWKRGDALGLPATRQSSIVKPLGASGQAHTKIGLGFKGSRQRP